jgi:hypothetical protein
MLLMRFVQIGGACEQTFAGRPAGNVQHVCGHDSTVKSGSIYPMSLTKQLREQSVRERPLHTQDVTLARLQMMWPRYGGTAREAAVHLCT